MFLIIFLPGSNERLGHVSFETSIFLLIEDWADQYQTFNHISSICYDCYSLEDSLQFIRNPISLPVMGASVQPIFLIFFFCFY